MRFAGLLGVLLAGSVLCGAGYRAAAAADAETSVALTLTKTPAAVEQKLGEDLLSLVELELQKDPSLAIVERRQIDVIVQEQVLDRSQKIDPQLQLGKLLTADCLAMLEFLPPEKDQNAGTPMGRLRVVDAKTAAIRGVTVASVDEATLEEVAGQFANYVSALMRAPGRPVVTVAVAPFESRGRFDRLRPLELGIRDLVTARLLELSGASTPDGKAEPDHNDAAQALAQPSFQVLQRSNLEQLLGELDLIRSGFADKSRLPDKLPPRGAAYLIRGEIDERQEGKEQTLIVRGEMVQALTRRVVDRFEFACPVAKLEEQLAVQTDRFGERLFEDEKIAASKHIGGRFEVKMLKLVTLTELRQIRRVDPIRGHDMFFHLPNQNRFAAAGGIEKNQPRTPLLHHLIRKSIDRLESIVFLHPDDAEAAYALGFCYSIHEPDIYRPERADEMLRKAFALGAETRLASLALDYLAQIDFDDRTGVLAPGEEAQAIGRIWFAFANKPQEKDSEAWYLLRFLGKMHQGPEQSRALADLLEKATPFAEQATAENREKLGMVLQELAIQLVRQAGDRPALKAIGFELLARWADGDDEELALWGRKGLAALAADQQDFAAAAEALEASAALIVDLNTPAERDRHDAQLVEAAKLYRTGGDPERALKLLDSFQVRFPTERQHKPAGDLPGVHDYEIGRCYELLGQHEKALAAYLHAVKINPTVAYGTDVRWRIERLGGFPLDSRRDVDVKYYPHLHSDESVPHFHGHQHLASDGQKIYAGGEEGVWAFDVGSESWERTSFPSQVVSCLKYRDGQIIAGTKSDGVWECDLATGQWRRVCPLQRLPDPRVVSLAVDGHDLYLGVGSKSSGGLVRIDGAGDGEVQVFDQPSAPPVAPTHIVVAKHRVYACTADAVYEWQQGIEAWLRDDAGKLARKGPAALFAGQSAIWASGHERELVKWQASKRENEQFRPAWCTAENNHGTYVHFVQHGYNVLFVAEHDDEVWFGGQPWFPLVSTGLYRFRLKTGEFHRFSPADGFKMSKLHYVFDGLWLNDRLWLATNSGLCVVTPVKNPSDVRPSEGK